MERLRFQTRIHIGYGILLAFTMLLFAFSLLELNRIGRNIEEIYKQPIVITNNIKEIELNVNASIFSVHNFLDTENDEISQQALKEIKEYDSLSLLNYRIIRKEFLGPKSDYANALIAYKDFANTRNNIILLKKSGNLAKAKLLNDKQSKKQVIVLLEKLELLSNFTLNKATSVHKKTISEIKSTRLIFILFTGVLIILGFLVSYFISKSITLPINHLLYELKSIYRKENILPKNETSLKSEQDLIFDVVTELKSAYSQLHEFNLNLEKRVEYRTRELQQSKRALIKTNKELIIQKEKAEYNEKLKSAFLANMSHEIRTPMNAILGFSNLLKENNLGKEKKQKFINLIQDSGKRLISIISDILDISKINTKQLPINIGTHNLNEILDSLYFQFLLHPKAKEIKIKVIKVLNDKDCFIKTDKNRLFQVLSNLIENALKFTDEGSITFGYTIESNNMQFFVKDTGMGVEPKYRETIFDRFTQVENENFTEYGNGLGLSIAKGLVELLKGEIWIDPNTKKGSKFLFTIPYVPVIQKDSFSSIAKETTADIEIERKTILIVEDENSNFIYLREVLKRLNINILRANNGLEAIKLFKSYPEIDIIFMDIKMPIMDGYQATIEIRKISSTIPIIALTAYAFSEDNSKAMAAGCNEYISKPVSKLKIEELLSTYFKTLLKGNVL